MGDTKAKQTSHPRSSEGLGHLVLAEAGQDKSRQGWGGVGEQGGVDVV